MHEVGSSSAATTPSIHSSRGGGAKRREAEPNTLVIVMRRSHDADVDFGTWVSHARGTQVEGYTRGSGAGVPELASARNTIVPEVLPVVAPEEEHFTH